MAGLASPQPECTPSGCSKQAARATLEGSLRPLCDGSGRGPSTLEAYITDVTKFLAHPSSHVVHLGSPGDSDKHTKCRSVAAGDALEATEKLYERHYLVIKIVSSFFACLIKFLYL